MRIGEPRSFSIQRSHFPASDIPIARVRNAPYSFWWQNIPPGSYEVIARAFGSNGATADSAPITVKVAPLWVVLDPSTPAQLNAPGRAFLSARTKAWQSSVERIEYYAGDTLLGSGTAINPSVEWKDIPAGTYTLRAKVYDSSGNSAASLPKTLNVLGPPTVQLVAPLNGATAPAGGSITLEAEATAPESRVNNVVFYRGSTQLGSDATAPYQYQWTNLPLGTHTLTATTSTPQGWSATSAPITINVTNDPGASITEPRAGQSLPSGSPINIVVQATMPLRAIDRVEIFADGALLSTVTANGAASFTANYSWADAAVGPHTLKATAHARDGTKVDTAEVTISVMGPIRVNLESPIGLTTVLASDAVHFAAQASQEAGSIATVEFLSGETLLARRMAPPYVFTWEHPPQGVHWVTAKAIDGTGRVASTAPIAVRSIESATIEIDPGIDGATVDDDRISVTGTIQAPNNSALIINGRAAAIDLLGNFFVNDVPLAPGSNVITASLSSEKRAKVANSLTVNSTGKASFAVSLDRYRGMAPVTINLIIANTLETPFTNINVQAEGSKVPLTTISNSPDRQFVIPISYQEPGVYLINVVVFGGGGKVIYQTTLRFLALDPVQIATLASQVYGNLLGRLRVGNIDEAVGLLSEELREAYAAGFRLLGEGLAEAATSLGRVRTVTVFEDFAVINLGRTENGVLYDYEVIVKPDQDGLWRIVSM